MTRSRKTITIIELIASGVILSAIVTLGIPLIRTVFERSKAKVCHTNLKVLQAAIENYGLENDILPSSLSQLNEHHVRRAWAQVLREEDPLTIKLAYFIVDLRKQGYAYAQENWIHRYFKGDVKAFTCPSDPTPPPQGVSYGINQSLANASYQKYKALRRLGKRFILAADCDHQSFSELPQTSKRHVSVKIMQRSDRYAYTTVVHGNKKVFVLPYNDEKGFFIPKTLQPEMSEFMVSPLPDTIMVPWGKQGDRPFRASPDTPGSWRDGTGEDFPAQERFPDETERIEQQQEILSKEIIAPHSSHSDDLDPWSGTGQGKKDEIIEEIVVPEYTPPSTYRQPDTQKGQADRHVLPRHDTGISAKTGQEDVMDTPPDLLPAHDDSIQTWGTQ